MPIEHNPEPIRQIDEIYTLSRALEIAAQAASGLALSAGASNHQIAQALDEAKQIAAQARNDIALPGSPLGEAQRHLVGRREVCRALSRLALEHGVDHQTLSDHLTQVTEAAAKLYHAETISDLGFAA